jgi:hypothetical protein
LNSRFEHDQRINSIICGVSIIVDNLIAVGLVVCVVVVAQMISIVVRNQRHGVDVIAMCIVETEFDLS